MIKQIEPNRVSLCGVDFAIYPFGAMKAANPVSYAHLTLPTTVLV